MTAKERFTKLANELDKLADISIQIGKHLTAEEKQRLDKTASERVQLDPAHVLNFAKFFLANR